LLSFYYLIEKKWTDGSIVVFKGIWALNLLKKKAKVLKKKEKKYWG